MGNGFGNKLVFSLVTTLLCPPHQMVLDLCCNNFTQYPTRLSKEIFQYLLCASPLILFPRFASYLSVVRFYSFVYSFAVVVYSYVIAMCEAIDFGIILLSG